MDKYRECNWRCPAHSEFQASRVSEALWKPVKTTLLNKGYCKLIRLLETGQEIPDSLMKAILEGRKKE